MFDLVLLLLNLVESRFLIADYQQKNKIFYEQYEMGKQDNIAFLKFCL